MEMDLAYGESFPVRNFPKAMLVRAKALVRFSRFVRNQLPDFNDRRRKLTPEQFSEIRQVYATGKMSIHQIAKSYGVSVSRAWNIIRNPDLRLKTLT